MYLEEIIGRDILENAELECKARLNRNDVEGWLKSVAGFANAQGGHFYIGVEDKTNKLIGFTREQADSERNFFNGQINQHVSPRPPYKVDFVRYHNGERELYILDVAISESPVRPVILRFRNVPSIYVRREGFTNGATYEEIISMSIASHNASYDTLPSDQEYRREDFGSLLEFHRTHSHGRELTDKALRSLGFFDADGCLVNGAVLFHDGCVDPKTSVQCSVFSGLTKGSERIVTVNRYKGPLTTTIDYMLEFVQQRMNHGMIKLPSSRVDTDAFPQRALFEGIINAVAHRDYFLDGTQIQVDMFADRLEISSPGSFFEGESLKKTYDLSSIISKRRNELICGVLVSCGVMEAAGTGFDKVAEDYRNADETHRPFILSSSDHFTLVLPDLTYGNGVASSDLPALLFAPVPSGGAHDEAILSVCYATARTAKDIAQTIGLSDSSYFRKRILGNLVEHGYLEKSTAGRTAYYKTNRGMVILA